MNHFVIAQCLISLWIIALVWFKLFGSLRRDEYRADIRRLRDSLFDFMWKSGFDFRTPAYVQARDHLNNMIRASNYLTPSLVFVAALCVARSKRQEESELQKAIDALDDGPLKDKLTTTHDLAIHRMLRFIFLEGTLGVFLRIVVYTLYTLQLCVKSANNVKAWISCGVLNIVETTRDTNKLRPPKGDSGLLAKTH